jgi:hypothetical protein
MVKSRQAAKPPRETKGYRLGLLHNNPLTWRLGGLVAAPVDAAKSQHALDARFHDWFRGYPSVPSRRGGSTQASHPASKH